MAKYFLDTGIILGYIRAANYAKLTTDKDFDHLDEEFLEVIYIDPKAKFI